MKSVKKAVKKVFKAITKTKIGRVLLAAATVYVGGAALGMWKAVGPLAKVNGFLVKGATKAGAGGVAGSTGGAVGGAAGGAAGGGAQGLVSGLLPEAVGGTGATIGGATGAGTTLAGSAALPTGWGVTGNLVTGGAVETAQQGIISKIMSGAGKALSSTADFATTPGGAMLISGAANAMSPDEMDLESYRRELDDRDRLRREQNLDVSGINVSRGRDDRQLIWDSTKEPVYSGGLIRPSMRAA